MPNRAGWRMEQAAAGPFTAGTIAVPRAGWRMEQGAAGPFTAGQPRSAKESPGDPKQAQESPGEPRRANKRDQREAV